MSNRIKFIISFAIFAFLFSAGFVLAAWRDAPAGPPNYGAVSPDTQDDYKPVNLGDTIQTKSGGLNIMGNVGIGTTALGYKLQVEGSPAPASGFSGYSGTTPPGNIWPNGYIPEAVFRRPSTGVISGVGGQLTYRGGMGLGDGVGIYSVNPNPAGSPYYGDIRFHTTWWDGSDYRNSDRMVIDQTGNIGIGTTGPSFSIGRGLHISGVAGTPDAVIELSETTSGLGNFELRSVARGTSGNRLEIGEGSDTFITIRSDDDGGGVTSRGNIGIGTTAPGYKLDVAGDANATRLCIAGTCKDSWSSASGVTASSPVAGRVPKWNTAGGELGNSFIRDSGTGIGIGADPGSYTLNVAGDIYTIGSGTAANGWFVSSDARLKKNVETLSGALDKIQRTRGVSYDLVNATSARQIGVIAQELEREFPELVVTDGNGYKAVAYDRLSAVLIEAVKELKSQNQTLQSRLDLLEKKW